MMKLNAIRIPCRNLEAAEQFYSDIIGWKKLFGSSEEGYIGYDLDDCLALLEPEEPGEFECGRYLGFSVSIEDLKSYYDQASRRGLTFSGPPTAQPWGGVMTHITDCSGNSFSIVETS